MYLKSIKYKRTYKEDTWSISAGDDPLVINSINLIIGQNSTGKSNTLRAIIVLADLLSGRSNVQSLLYNTASYDVEFWDDSTLYRYVLKYKNGIIISELLSIDGIAKIDRSKSQMYFEQINSMLPVSTEDYMVLAARRDSTQHSYLDKLYLWALRLSVYEFGSSMGKDIGVKDPKLVLKETVNLHLGNNPISKLLHGKRDIVNFENRIIEDFKRLKYDITAIDVKGLNRPDIQGNVLTVQESCLRNYTDQFEMSQGMFRALALIIQIEYSIATKTPNCILIDDIGEGLDYERSQELINLIIERAEAFGLQVIMTTNDRFVMNAIDIKYWNIISRSGKDITFYNINNSSETFANFRMMGLNNFEFFHSELYKGIDIQGV